MTALSIISLPSRASLISLYQDGEFQQGQDNNDDNNDAEKKTTDVLATFHNDRKGLLLCMLCEKYGINKLLEHGVLQHQQLVVNRGSLLELYKDQEKDKDESTLKGELDTVIELFENDSVALLKAMETKYSAEIVLPFVCPMLKQISTQRKQAKDKLEQKKQKMLAQSKNNNDDEQLQQPSTEKHSNNQDPNSPLVVTPTRGGGGGAMSTMMNSNADPNTIDSLAQESTFADFSNAANSTSNQSSPQFNSNAMMPTTPSQSRISPSTVGDLVQSGTSHFSPSMARRMGISPAQQRKQKALVKAAQIQQQQQQQNQQGIQDPSNSSFGPEMMKPQATMNFEQSEAAKSNNTVFDSNASRSVSRSMSNNNNKSNTSTKSQSPNTNNNIHIKNNNTNTAANNDDRESVSSNDSDDDAERFGHHSGHHRGDAGLTFSSGADDDEGNLDGSHSTFNANALSRYQSMSVAASRRLNKDAQSKQQDVKELLTQFYSREGMPKKTLPEIEFLAFKYADSKGELLDKLRRQYGDIALTLAGFGTGSKSSKFGTTSGILTSGSNNNRSALLSPTSEISGGGNTTGKDGSLTPGSTSIASPSSATTGPKKSVGFQSQSFQDENNNNKRDQDNETPDIYKQQQNEQHTDEVQRATMQLRAQLVNMSDSEAEKFLAGEDPKRRVPHFIELFASPSGRILYGYWSTMCLRIGTTGMKRLHYSLARFSPRMPVQASAALACTFENELFVDGEPASMVKRRMLRRDQQINMMKEQALQYSSTFGGGSFNNNNSSSSNGFGDSFRDRHSGSWVKREDSSLSTQTQAPNSFHKMESPASISSSAGGVIGNLGRSSSENSNHSSGSYNHEFPTSRQHRQSIIQNNNSMLQNNNNNNNNTTTSSASFFAISGTSFFEEWEHEAVQTWTASTPTQTSAEDPNINNNNSSMTMPSSGKNTNTKNNKSSSSQSSLLGNNNNKNNNNNTTFRVSTAAEVWSATIMRDIIRFREDVVAIIGKLLRDESRERTNIQLRAWQHQRLMMEVTDRAFNLVIDTTLIEAEEQRRRVLTEAEDIDFRGLMVFFFRYRSSIPEAMSSLDFLSAVVDGGGGGKQNNNTSSTTALGSDLSPSNSHSSLLLESSINNMTSFFSNNLTNDVFDPHHQSPGRNNNKTQVFYQGSSLHHQNSSSDSHNTTVENSLNRINNNNNDNSSKSSSSSSPQAQARIRMISHFQDLSRTARIAAEQSGFQQASFAFRTKDDEAQLRHLITYGEKINMEKKDAFINPFQSADRQAEARISRMQALFGVSAEGAKKSFQRATKKVAMLSRFSGSSSPLAMMKGAAKVSSSSPTSSSPGSPKNDITPSKNSTNNSNKNGKEDKDEVFSPSLNRQKLKSQDEFFGEFSDDESSPTGLTPYLNKNQNKDSKQQQEPTSTEDLFSELLDTVDTKHKDEQIEDDEEVEEVVVVEEEEEDDDEEEDEEDQDQDDEQSASSPFSLDVSPDTREPSFLDPSSVSSSAHEHHQNKYQKTEGSPEFVLAAASPDKSKQSEKEALLQNL